MKSTIAMVSVFLAFVCSRAFALTDGSFEGPYTTLTGSSIVGHVASGWVDNSAWSSSVMTYACDNTTSHSGYCSQKITLSSNTTAQFIQPLTLTLGRTYMARVWMKASAPTTVWFQLRQSGAPYTTYLGNNSVALNTGWQQVTIAGQVPGSGTSSSIFMIQMSTPATIWVDDASLDDITPSPQILTNGGFEGTYYTVSSTTNITGSIAPGWNDNSAWSNGVVQYSADTTNPHSGSTSQKITLSSGSPVQFLQGLNLTQGRIYTASVWLRAAAPTTVAFSIRQSGSPYTGYLANYSVPVTTSWSQVSLSGLTGAGSALFLIEIDNPATIWVDDASLTDTTPPVPQSPVSNDYFGMHFSLGAGSPPLPWPCIPVGTWRLWDNNVTWRLLQPNSSNSGSNPSTWDSGTLATLDSYVAAAQANNTTIIMTLGQTPDWATTYRGNGYYGQGAPGYPTNLQSWTDYLTGLGNRYKGKIHYWEIWNEPNDPGFWGGTSAQMVTLTQQAQSVLKGIDPSNQIISPSAVGDPSDFLNGYLAAGGAAYCDVMGYHLYVTPNAPEQQVSTMGLVLNCLAQYGVYKPIWNTEEGWTSGVPDDATGEAYVARSYLLAWAYGLEGRYAFYRWENNNVMDINLTGPGQNNSLSNPGVAYANVRAWMTSGVVMNAISTDSNNTWLISVTRPYTNPTYAGYILWNPTQTISNYAIPGGWGITTKRTLDGTVVSYGSSTVSVGSAPILLENGPQSSLVAHWNLDESPYMGYSLDSTTNYMNGGWQNGPMPSTFVPPAIIYSDPYCLTFNGVNQYVDMGNPSALPSGAAPRTMCGWAKAASTAAGYRFMAAFGSPNTSQAMIIGMNGTTLVGGGYGDDLQVSNFWDGNWHFIALTYDGTNAKLYADGALVASGAKTWNLVQSHCYLGQQVNGSECWNGSIDDVRIYNRALSATEISNLAAGNP